MATLLSTAGFSGADGGHFELRLEYDLVQDISLNKSTITYYLKMRSKDNYSASGSTSNGYINNEWVGSFSSIGRNTTITIGTKTVPVEHEADGTKSVSFSASINTNWDRLYSASVSGTLNLPKINRGATTNSVASENGDVTGTFSVNYTKHNENYTYKLRISIPHVVLLDRIDYNTSETDFTLSNTVLNTLYTSDVSTMKTTNEVQLGFAVEGWSGDTRITEGNEVIITGRLIDPNPTMTYTIEEKNNKVVALLGSSANTVIQNASRVEFTVTPTPKYSSTITRVDVNNLYTTTSPYRIMLNVSSNSFTIKATDSRNNVTSQTTTKTFIEYQPIDILNLTMKRVNPTSSNIVLNLEANYYQQTFGSTPNVPIIKWKLDDGSYTTIPSTEYTIDTTNNKLTITNYVIQNALVYTSPGTFTIEASDLLTEDTDSRDVLKGIPTFDAGEHDLKVNGDLYIADTNGENKVNVLPLIQPKLLWTNPNPNVGFARQTVTLSSDDYDILEVFFYDYINTTRFNSVKIPKGEKSNMFSLFDYNGGMYMGRRTAHNDSDTTVLISGCFSVITNSVIDVRQSDEWIIPVYIVGYKTGLF